MHRIYLACPYSHPDPEIRESRVHYVSKVAAQLMQENNVVFSPLSHSYPIADHIGNHLEHDFWLKQCLSFIPWCDELRVLQLDGWDKSHGIKMEVDAAKKTKKIVSFIRPS